MGYADKVALCPFTTVIGIPVEITRAKIGLVFF